MESHSLLELNDYIKQVIALNFTESFWINCEIAQVGESRGNYYIELIEKDETKDEVVARMSAAIWFKSYLFIKKKLGALTDDILSAGTKVLLRVNVTFHEVYGMKLSIVDIDPSYTIGAIEIEKTKIIDRLKRENLLDKNAENVMPPVLQNIAVLSSETAAGYADFINQLKDNEYGYKFDLRLFNVAVQGKNVEREVVKVFDELRFSDHEYDVVVLIRGGGSKMDLACFDNYNISAAIADCKFPVISGIGHEIDDVIVDFVAHTSLKTPTAVANYILDRNLMFESRVVETYQRAEKLITASISQKQLYVENLSTRVDSSIQIWMQKQNSKLEMASKIIEMSNPDKILAKGFYMIEHDGNLISDIDNLEEGTEIKLIGQTHSATANIKEVSNGK